MDEADHQDNLGLYGEGEPGQLIFDWVVSEEELAAIADQLGIRLVSGTEETQENQSGGTLGVKLKAFSAESARERTQGTTVSYAAAPLTRCLALILGRLREDLALTSMNSIAPSHLDLAARHAGDGRWLIGDGRWRLRDDPLTLELVELWDVRTGSGVPIANVATVEFAVPADGREAFSAGGRRRFASPLVRADVLGYGQEWDGDHRRFTGIAVAVFHRVGEPDFRWGGVSLGESGGSEY